MISMNATAAGSYEPTVPGARTLAEAKPLYIGTDRVTAVVDEDGGYSVFVGVRVVATGELDGTEGDLMAYFAQAAIRSAMPDVAAGVEAMGCDFTFTRGTSRMKRNMSNAEVVRRIRWALATGRTVEIKETRAAKYIEIINARGLTEGRYFASVESARVLPPVHAEQTTDVAAVVEALGNDFTADWKGDYKIHPISNAQVVQRIRESAKFGQVAEIKDGVDCKYIDISNGRGSVYARFYFA